MTLAHRLFRAASAASFAFAGCLLAAPVLAQTEVSRRVDASPTGTVTIDNLAGSVVVRGWERNEVEVTGTLGRDVERLDVDSSAGSVAIEVVLPRHGRNSGAADLEIKVPHQSRLRVELVSASATVAGVTGEVRVETVSGSIEVEGDAGSIHLESVSGSIEVRSKSATVSAETVSGELRLLGVRGDVEGSTVSGSIEVSGDELGRVRVESVSGTVDFDGTLAPRADLDLESHSGSLVVRLPAEVSARFEATTYSGRIRNALGPAAQKSGRFSPESTLEFTAGGGDASIRLETFSGSIEIRKR